MLLISSACQERVASEEVDFEALKIDACERACGTIDSCAPGKFDGMEPDDCFERCMTLLPRLHEENQCGSHDIIWLRCLGDLDCEGYAAFGEGNDRPYPPDYTAPCVVELQALCSTDEPFDLDHVPSVP